MIAADDDRSYVGENLTVAHVDGKPMPPFTVSQTNAQIKMAAKIRRLIKVRGMNVSEACKVAGVSRRWFYYHRDLIERPTVALAS